MAALAICFFLCGFAVIPYVGVQTDEAIFTSALFDDPYPWFYLSVFKKHVPLMIMTYLGATKAALWSLVFTFWEPSAYSLRVPALVLGSISVVLCYLFLRRAVGTRAALFATALLSFDTSYLLSTVLDWGPVAIQHVCLLAGMWLVLRFRQTQSLPSLAGAFFFLGLGMWDKAIFAWMLSGTAIACLLVFPQSLMRELSVKKISVAVVFFILGALPLIIYNVRKQGETFRGNTVFSAEGLEQKRFVLESTVRGRGFFGFVVFQDHEPGRRAPLPGFETEVVRFAHWTGNRSESLYWPALLLSIAASPLLLFTRRWRRPVLFVWLAFSIAWAQMLFNQGTGGGIHHVILLWPLPTFLVAFAMEALAERCGRLGTPLTAALAAILCLSSLLVMATYQRMFITNGAPGVWTDAIFRLSDRLMERKPAGAFLADWGMLDNMRMLQRARLRLLISDAAQKPEPGEKEYKDLRWALAQDGFVFVTNTDDRQVYPVVNANLAKMSDELGYDRQLLETVTDSHGRPCYEIYRFQKRPRQEPVSVGIPQRVPERAPLPANGIGAVPQVQPAVK